MKIVPTPSALSARIAEKMTSTSCSPSDDVGSSITTTRALRVSARAISTNCCSASRKRRTARVGLTRKPTRAKTAAASAFKRFRSTTPAALRGKFPRYRFSAMLRWAPG